jgi:ADP-heptose:LPS heptosyltransferase
MTQLNLKKTKRLIEFITHYALDYFLIDKTPANCKSNNIAIMQTRLIGDFFLWLPFLEKIVESMGIKQQRVTIIISSNLVHLVRLLFPTIKIIGIDTKRITRDIAYRRRVFSEISSLDLSLIINENIPRDGLIGDSIVRASKAKESIGYSLTFSDRSKIDCSRHSRLYTNLIESDIREHQSQHHQRMLKHLGISSSMLSSELLFRSISPEYSVYDPYFVIAPGASDPSRRWASDNYASICTRIFSKSTELNCLIIGTNAELELCKEIENRLSGNRIINLCGKTSVIGLISIIAKSKFLIGNDSAAGHIAAAYGTKSIIITGGGHFGRFFPYDLMASIAKEHPIVVNKEADCYGCDWNCKFISKPNQCFPCINEISVDDTWAKVEVLINQIQYKESQPNIHL